MNKYHVGIIKFNEVTPLNIPRWRVDDSVVEFELPISVVAVERSIKSNMSAVAFDFVSGPSKRLFWVDTALLTIGYDAVNGDHLFLDVSDRINLGDIANPAPLVDSEDDNESDSEDDSEDSDHDGDSEHTGEPATKVPKLSTSTPSSPGSPNDEDDDHSDETD